MRCINTGRGFNEFCNWVQILLYLAVVEYCAFVLMIKVHLTIFFLSSSTDTELFKISKLSYFPLIPKR